MTHNAAIFNMVRQQTKTILDSGETDGRGIDAYTLSIDLKMDRANVSRALNSLWREGLLIKFQGKPTLFLDRKLVSEYHPGFFIPQTAAKGETLSNLIRAGEENSEPEDESSSLEQLIGADTSLKEAIVLAKAAAAYPPYGLHTLLNGSIGVGKNKFAHCMYLYKKSAAPPGGSIPFVSVTCHNFSENPKLFSQQLLGLARDVTAGKSRRGFLDGARGGILFFDEIEYLSPASLELIASVITKNSYNRIGDNVSRQIQCMIVASTTCSADDGAIRVLTESLPVSIHIPDLEERGIYEKIELMIQLFSEEARAIRLPIKISKDVLICLASMKYAKNIMQLTNEVKSACSRAYLDSLDNHYKTVYVRLHNLSRELLSYPGEGGQRDLVRHILDETPDQYIEMEAGGGSKYLDTFKSVPAFSSMGAQKILESRLGADIESVDNIYQTVVSNISGLSNCKGVELHALKRSIYPIVFQIVIAELQKRGKYEESKKHIHLLYGILLHITNFLKRTDIHTPPSRKEPPAASRDSFPEEYQMAVDIMESLSQIYSCCFSNREIDYLASYFAIFSNWTTTVNLGLLVICHGEAMASDLVSYALKTIYDDYIIDYINFSSSMSLAECLDLAAEKARQLNRGSGILILTDMEPLTTVNDYITRQTGIDASIVYPVTLPLLLESIRQILSNRSDFSLLSPAGEVHSSRSENLGSQEVFIQNLVDKVISKTTVFLDTTKAVNVLEKCLKATLMELQLPYSNEIAAKYLCHCCNMLERAIRGETWSYSRLNGFTNENHELMYTVEHKLEYAENIFGIKIPAGEIAYITEIFLS